VQLLDNSYERKALEFAGFNERQAILAARRSLKMARSVHAYVRGSTRKFYEWLEASDVEALPRGPAVWRVNISIIAGGLWILPYRRGDQVPFHCPSLVEIGAKR
jgi:hypothetical protein